MKPPFPPLLKIFTTPAFIGLLLTHIGSNWGSFIIITLIPTYLNNIQHVSLKSVSYFSFLKFLLNLDNLNDFLLELEQFNLILCFETEYHWWALFKSSQIFCTLLERLHTLEKKLFNKNGLKVILSLNCLLWCNHH